MENKVNITDILNTVEFPNNFKIIIDKDTSPYDIIKLIAHFKSLGLYTEMVYDTQNYMFRVFKPVVYLNKVKKIDKTFEERIDDSMSWLNNIKPDTSFLIHLTSPNPEYKMVIDDTLKVERGSILYDKLIKCFDDYKKDLEKLGGKN